MKPLYSSESSASAGAGMRGGAYAEYARQHPDEAKVVAVAEPRKFQRDEMARTHDIPSANVFASWEGLAAAPRLADAAIITTQDLFVFERSGFDENNRVAGTFRPTGIRPKLADRLESCGIRFSIDAFSAESRMGGRR